MSYGAIIDRNRDKSGKRPLTKKERREKKKRKKQNAEIRKEMRKARQIVVGDVKHDNITYGLEEPKQPPRGGAGGKGRM